MTAPTQMLFPGMKAELVIIAAQDNTIRLMSEFHDDDVDAFTFFTLAVVQILMHAKRMNVDPDAIFSGVMRLAGDKRP